MKIGLSSYSRLNDIRNGSLDITDVMDFAKKAGAYHIELVPFGFTLYDDQTGTFNYSLIEKIKEKSFQIGLPISNYSVLGDLLKPTESERTAEIERLKKHIDVAAMLGISSMRHDIASFRRPLEINTPLDFEREFPVMVSCCRILAEYAQKYDITTMAENHGFFVNGADRLIRLIDAVNRPNFKMLIDIGNFSCVEDDCSIAVKKCLPFAHMIHLKDFYIRKTEVLSDIGGLFRCDSGCWFYSNSEKYMMRGAILGQGDLDINDIFRTVSEYGFDGYASVEFEGMEDSATGSEISLFSAKELWQRVSINNIR